MLLYQGMLAFGVVGLILGIGMFAREAIRNIRQTGSSLVPALAGCAMAVASGLVIPFSWGEIVRIQGVS